MPEQLAFFPFALMNEWGESYPAIFMLSCLAALIVAIVGLTRKPGGRDGQLSCARRFIWRCRKSCARACWRSA